MDPYAIYLKNAYHLENSCLYQEGGKQSGAGQISTDWNGYFVTLIVVGTYLYALVNLVRYTMARQKIAQGMHSHQNVLPVVTTKEIDPRLIPYFRKSEPLNRKEDLDLLLSYCKLSDLSLPQTSRYSSNFAHFIHALPLPFTLQEIKANVERISQMRTELNLMNGKAQSNGIEKRRELQKLIKRTLEQLQVLFRPGPFKIYKFVYKGLQGEMYHLLQSDSIAIERLLLFLQGAKEYWDFKIKFQNELEHICRMIDLRKELLRYLQELDPYGGTEQERRDGVKNPKSGMVEAVLSTPPELDFAFANWLEQNIRVGHLFSASFFEQLPIISKSLEKSVDLIHQALTNGEKFDLEQHLKMIQTLINSSAMIPTRFAETMIETERKRQEMRVHVITKAREFHQEALHSSYPFARSLTASVLEIPLQKTADKPT